MAGPVTVYMRADSKELIFHSLARDTEAREGSRGRLCTNTELK